MTSWYILGNILHDVSSDVISNGALAVKGTDIEFVGELAAVQDSLSGDVLDFRNSYIMPGLIDTHCHLALPGLAPSGRTGKKPKSGDHRVWDYISSRTDEQLLLTAAGNAYNALRKGITTLRDLGGPGRLTFALRDGILEGLFPGPRLILAGRALTITGGHGWWCGAEVDNRTEIVREVRTLAKEGADVIKVMASSGTPLSWFPSFEVDDLRLIVEEAHKWGIEHVAAHCTSPEAIRRCVQAGIDGIEHATFRIDGHGTTQFVPDVANMMAEHEVYVAPTLQTTARTQEEESAMSPAERARYAVKDKAKLEDFAHMLDHDITMVAGSDAGWGSALNRFGNMALGMRIMSENGMPKVAVLEAATSTAAKALGMDDLVGTLTPGRKADFIVVDGNPLEDLSVLDDVLAVFLEGSRIV